MLFLYLNKGVIKKANAVVLTQECRFTVVIKHGDTMIQEQLKNGTRKTFPPVVGQIALATWLPPKIQPGGSVKCVYS